MVIDRETFGRDAFRGRAPLVAARGSLLNRRALRVAIGTVHAAVTLERSQQRPAGRTVVIELTSICRHQFLCVVPALGARQRRVQFNIHGLLHRRKRKSYRLRAF